MKILNIYGQVFCHQEARITGNKEGLLQLKHTIEKALQEGKATTETDVAHNEGNTVLFASDGEGYEVIVVMNNDEWGIKGGNGSFWNKEESYPEYTSLSDIG